ncbi:unnamed protein product [Microthlaspi erraticum]|uniref:F-box domain-containing protein n=1 Tax=Microthlaspi erraticum TaxID=1685480 RepID=A0A6D2J108_9BRAS|nr:unnamed protein product [Microthlaspi erraticum]
MMTKRGKSTGSSSQRLKELNRISELPDPLICQILSHLSTKEAVSTSVLSTRWRSLWLCVPALELGHWNLSDFSAFVSFCDRFFDSSRVSCIHRVKLNIAENEDEANPSHLKSWINAAVKRKIQRLNVLCPPESSYVMPGSLYKCETLVSLKLQYLEVNFVGVEFVSLPCLKTLHLKYVRYNRNDANFERLVSCCPVLEELEVLECDWLRAIVYRVVSRSLKKLTVHIHEDEPESEFRSGFVVDAPRLRFLSINDNLSDSFVIKNMDSDSKVDLSLPFGLIVFDEASVSSRRSSVGGFLSGISKVRDMTICKDTFKLICKYSRLEPLPQFGHLSHLRVTLYVSQMKWLPTFLERCPNLKSLVLVWDGNSERMCEDDWLNPRIRFSSVPECLLSSLEFVEFKTSITGHAPEITLVSYFLENSTILKKLTLRLDYYYANEKDFFTVLRVIPKRSITCQVVVL